MMVTGLNHEDVPDSRRRKLLLRRERRDKRGQIYTTAPPMWQVVFGQQASFEVKMHAVYCIQFLGFPIRTVAYLFGKGKSSVDRWNRRFVETGTVERKMSKEAMGKLGSTHKLWILKYVLFTDPLTYLHELKEKFHRHFGFSVHESTLSRFLVSKGITKKVIERRAMQVRQKDVSRFTSEMNFIQPLQDQLLFLDEMSCDNRSMLRKKGWGLIGEKVLHRAIFKRSKRISVLAFLGVDGIVEVFQEEGTFTRLKFFNCIKNLLVSGKVEKYPGRNSVWVLDGASIHLSPDIVSYLFCMGIKVIFLPAYAPFFNPIENLFGMVKRYCQRIYIVPGLDFLVYFVLHQLIVCCRRRAYCFGDRFCALFYIFFLKDLSGMWLWSEWKI
jgi:transposase